MNVNAIRGSCCSCCSYFGAYNCNSGRPVRPCHRDGQVLRGTGQGTSRFPMEKRIPRSAIRDRDGGLHVCGGRRPERFISRGSVPPWCGIS